MALCYTTADLGHVPNGEVPDVGRPRKVANPQQMRRPPPRDKPPSRRFRRDLPRPEGPFDRLLRRRPERDPAPIIIGGTIAFLVVVILLVVGLSSLFSGGDGGGGGNSDVRDFGGRRGPSHFPDPRPAARPRSGQRLLPVQSRHRRAAPPCSGFALPLSETIDDPAGLGFYSFGEDRWRRLADVKVVQKGRAEGEFSEIPANLVVLRVLSQPYQVAGSLPPGGTLHADARITIVSPRDYAPAQDGSISGTATAIPRSGRSSSSPRSSAAAPIPQT